MLVADDPSAHLMPVTTSTLGSFELVHLACRDAVMTITPRAGLCVVSLMVGGVEILALPASLAEFLAAERTGGIPLLYPWANRLRGDDPVVLGRTLATSGAPRCHRDGNGLPLHGLLLRWPAWSIDECRADDTTASFAASLEWAKHDELLAAFPFPHRLVVRFDLAPTHLHVTTRVEAHDTDVPASFGWHPYLRLAAPSAERAIRLPARREVSLDDRRLPMRGSVGNAMTAMTAPVALGAADDLFADIAEGAQTRIIDGPRSRTVDFVHGFDHLQLFSQRDGDFICVEPMTAAIAGLSDGAFQRAPRNGTFEAVWRLAW